MHSHTADTTSVRVLYVDDSPPSALANHHGFAVETVRTAAAAREYLDAVDRSVDCVVSEYALADSDGIALLESVREDHPNLPFVVYTSEGNEEVASEAVRRGVDDYLTKGADDEEFRRRVSRVAATASVETEAGLPGEQMRELTNAFPDPAFIIDETGRYLEVLSGPGTDDLETVGQEQLVGRTLHDAFDDDQADEFLALLRRTLATGRVETMEYQLETESGSRWFESRTAPLSEPIDGRGAVVWVARDVTERRENERELAASHEQLETLNRVNGLVNDILQSLVESATREEIERTVCEGLANSEFYNFAWAGTPWSDEEGLRVDAVAGVERERFEHIVDVTTDKDGANESIDRVIRTNESLVISDVRTCSFLSEHERELLVDVGMVSAVVVPLTYGQTNYGVLGVSGMRPDAFDGRERVALETLGEIVAFAINAVKNRQLLFSDTSIELEFRDEGAETLTRTVSEELECRLELDGTVPVSEDRLLHYISIEGAPPEAMVSLVGDDPDIEEHRVVESDGDSGLIEVVFADSGVNRLVDLGTIVETAVVDEGVTRIVAKAPPDADVRAIVENFRAAYPTAELVGKRVVESLDRTAQDYDRSMTEELTEKQQTALRAAYYAGYYGYPRGSTAEEIADSLDISSPTLHQHLRAAQRKLLGTLFDR
ncbi:MULTISPECIES: bacterio-opsin activator domain-containing protein [Halorussus]|uniref:bacterio-opsin activator domain-containing protein n=1 Tax=Halorussus TaxID=1070314 RepID=UPI0020A0D41D|nr:bacterio-opsin activator domain-containing protein [Halorussus vallis]USZ76331.1 helix-turn-helix domain-containing protein [Halorussus vallis]